MQVSLTIPWPSTQCPQTLHVLHQTLGLKGGIGFVFLHHKGKFKINTTSAPRRGSIHVRSGYGSDQVLLHLYSSAGAIFQKDFLTIELCLWCLDPTLSLRIIPDHPALSFIQCSIKCWLVIKKKWNNGKMSKNSILLPLTCFLKMPLLIYRFSCR